MKIYHNDGPQVLSAWNAPTTVAQSAKYYQYLPNVARYIMCFDFVY